MSPPPAGWSEVAVAADAAEAEIHGAVVGELALGLVRDAERWFAFEDQCTHARCSFSDDGEVADGVLICNCHGAEFDLATGQVLLEPAEEPLAVFDVRVEDGRVLVQVEDRSDRAGGGAR